MAARRHEDLLQRELGVAPDPTFTQTVEGLR
jgi:hypothetical protein